MAGGGGKLLVSALSLSLRDKERLRDWEIERAWQFHTQKRRLESIVYDNNKKTLHIYITHMISFNS